MNKNLKKILSIISIIIFIIGIILSVSISNMNLVEPSSGKIYVDGTDFSAITDAVGIMGESLIQLILIFYVMVIALALILAIWIVYGIVILIKKIINKIK